MKKLYINENIWGRYSQDMYKHKSKMSNHETGGQKITL